VREDITQDYLKSRLTYSPEDGAFYWKRKPVVGKQGAGWNIKYVDKRAGYISISGYELIRIDYLTWRAHRLAWLYVHGRMPASDIDHINHDRSDNRIINLREVTGGDNQKNKSMHKNNTSGTAGVIWNPTNENWMTQIRVNYRTVHIGSYAEKRDAIIARKAAEKALGFHKNHGRKVT